MPRRSIGRTSLWSRSASAAGFGRSSPARTPGLQKKAGFTLLEVLVVLALIGLISALLIGSSDALLKSIGKDDLESAALSAIGNARHSAVLAGRQLELHLDDPTRTLDWEEGNAVLTGEGNVRLLPAVKTSAMLVGGQSVEAPLARVRFYADGTCDPFRLEIVRDKVSRILSIDPWTCTPLSPEATPGPH